MPDAFYRYVRGLSDELPAGYALNGMRAYRHLVFIGASQMVAAHYPDMRERLGEDGWRMLIEAFVRDSAWTSPYYGDLHHEFLAFIARESA